MARPATYVGTALAIAVLWAGLARAQPSDPVAYDFDSDGIVGFEDFLTFARGYGKAQGDPAFDARLDLNADGTVDFTDFLAFARNYGRDTGGRMSDLLYIADLLAGRLVVVNTTTNLTDLTRTVALSQPRGLAFSAVNGRVYVAGVDSFYALTEGSSRTYQVPLQDPPPTPEDAPVARGGFRVALSDDHAMGFVTEEFVGRLEVLDLSDGASLAQIPVGREPVGVAVSPDGDYAFVASKDRWLRRVDARALVLQDSIALDGWGNGRVVISPSGDRAYSARTLETSTPAVQIVEIDLQTASVARFLEVAVAGHLSTDVVDLALAPDGARLLASVQRLVPVDISGVSSFAFEGDLVAVDLASFEILAELPLGERVGTIGLSSDGRTAYVGGITSILEDPAFKVFIVDLDPVAYTGFLSGFELPAAIGTPPAKPAAWPPLPDLSVF
jgi:DNA-binding beta-propeller fold protein YncE